MCVCVDGGECEGGVGEYYVCVCVCGWGECEGGVGEYYVCVWGESTIHSTSPPTHTCVCVRGGGGRGLN